MKNRDRQKANRKLKEELETKGITFIKQMKVDGENLHVFIRDHVEHKQEEVLELLPVDDNRVRDSI